MISMTEEMMSGINLTDVLSKQYDVAVTKKDDEKLIVSDCVQLKDYYNNHMLVKRGGSNFQIFRTVIAETWPFLHQSEQMKYQYNLWDEF